MTVHVVTDSSSCIPSEVAEEISTLTVMDLYVSGQGAERTTAGLGALELTAMYARLLERGGDEGVVAIHMSKELSATWSNAVSAAGIFEGSVKIVDSNSVGMVMGMAAIQGAKAAEQGHNLEEVAAIIEQVLKRAKLWLYVHRLDTLRRSGRLSAGQTLLSTALAIKPILQLSDGRLELAAKTRTKAKAMDKMVALIRDFVLEARDSNDSGELRGGDPNDGAEARVENDMSVGDAGRGGSGEGVVGAGLESKAGSDELKNLRAGADHQSPNGHCGFEADGECLDTTGRSSRRVHVVIHQIEAQNDAVNLQERLRAAVAELPAENQIPVEVDVVEMSPVVAAHTGPGSIGLAAAVL